MKEVSAKLYVGRTFDYLEIHVEKKNKETSLIKV